MNLSKILPPKPLNILERERLTNKLRSWEDKKLVIIHGQAGQGKSTLASDYVRSLTTPAVWYNMDQEDENPAVFLSCLGQAIQRAWPGRIPKMPSVPQNRYGVGGMYRSMSRWITQVFGSLPDQGLIVFDDFNLVAAPQALNPILRALIDSTPHHIRFMIISRTRPEIDTVRLRARRALGEIDGEELRFSDSEVQELFSTVFGMPLGTTEAASLNRMAEGWVAGLVLMHEYLASVRTSLDKPISLGGYGLAGFQNQVFDYLAQEVFSNLSTDLQGFLLRTSIVDYLPAALVELLTGLPAAAPKGKPSTQSLVAELRKKNLFISTLEGETPVIRYHALFRGFLRKKLLAQAMPSEVKQLYTKAARFFEKAGDPVRTINLYVESGQFDRAIAHIETRGLELIARGQTQTLLRWIEALPLDFGERPWFLFYRAVSCRFTDPRRALLLFERALDVFRKGGRGLRSLQGQMLALAGIIEACFYTGGDFKRMERAARSASMLLRRGGRELAGTRARLLLALGTAFFFTGKLRDGAGALVEALELFRKAGDHFYQIHSAIYLAPCAIYLGDFALARDAVRKGYEAHQSIPEETGGEAALSMAQAMTALFEGRFDESQDCIDRCHALAHEHELEAFDFLSLDIGGWLRIATRDHAGAEALLEECKRKGADMGNAFFHTSAAHLLAVNHLHLNRLDEALAECRQALAVRSRLGSRLFYAVSLSANGAILTRLGKFAAAERDLKKALDIFRKIGAAQQEANVHLALANLAAKRKRRAEELGHLRSAFSIGEERGFTYYYLFTDRDVAELARTAAEAGICPDYTSRLASRRDGVDASAVLRISCLGGFQVVRGRHAFSDKEWKSRRAKSVVKFLAAQERNRAPRERVLDALWNGASPDTAGASLTSVIQRLRRLLDPSGALQYNEPCILLDSDRLMLNPDRVWTDVDQFHYHVNEARKQTAAGNREGSLGELEKAIELYRGDFLPEDLYAEWTVPAREQLRSAYLKALEEAASIAEALGNRERAAALHDRLFQADPCSEKACRWIMSWHRSTGRRGDALRIYERCERALSRELDVAPDRQTTALYRAIISDGA